MAWFAAVSLVVYVLSIMYLIGALKRTGVTFERMAYRIEELTAAHNEHHHLAKLDRVSQVQTSGPSCQIDSSPRPEDVDSPQKM